MVRVLQVILGVALILAGVVWGLMWLGIAAMAASFGGDASGWLVVGACLMLALGLIAAGIHVLEHQDRRAGRGPTAHPN